ncbi:MAG: universal stress protein [Candidatus Rokubacteria bacterium]|nr:universal stress protein [Candidatus Rokubacteria bacterium]
MAHGAGPPVREIVLATDFSEASEPAVQTARDYARLFGARVHLLHVASSEEGNLAPLLAGLADTFTPTATVVRTIPGGVPAREIVKYARDHAIDLIIMGTHGRTGMSRALLGSVAERVVRTAPCPVLTVAGTVRTTPMRWDEAPDAEPRQCLVCARTSEDLICEPCRAHIRGELLERKRRDERAGRQ